MGAMGVPQAFPSLTNSANAAISHPLVAKIGKRGLDNCGKNHKKPYLAQRFPVFAAAGEGAAAVEGESLRQVDYTSLHSPAPHLS